MATSPAPRAVIFEKPGAAPPFEIGEWIDLYVLLEVPPQSRPETLETAIISRSADCLCFAFSRGGKPARIVTLERYLHDFRPVLLNAATRDRYDQLLAGHYRGEAGLEGYDEFIAGVRAGLPVPSSGCLQALVLGLPLAILRSVK